MGIPHYRSEKDYIKAVENGKIKFDFYFVDYCFCMGHINIIKYLMGRYNFNWEEVLNYMVDMRVKDVNNITNLERKDLDCIPNQEMLNLVKPLSGKFNWKIFTTHIESLD